MSEEKLTQLTTEAGIRLDLADEAGVPLGQITVSPSMTAGDLSTHAPVFGLPDSSEYSLYQVTTGPDGTERTKRLAPSTRLGDIDLGDEEVLRLRFAAPLKGA